MICVEEIVTERLVLRKLTKKDINDYIAWKTQEEYHAFLPTKPKQIKEYKSSVRKIVKNYGKKKQSLFWAIALKDSNQLIGSVNISKISSTHKCCEIGWGLNPKFQKNGYAFESVKAVINLIFKNLELNKISALIWKGNKPSIKLAKKLGFILEGTERQARIKNGAVLDVLHVGLLREEWLLGNPIERKE